QYCTRLLADFGAEVVKVEPAEGDRLRRAAPRIDLADGSEASLAFAYLNFGKASLVAGPGDLAPLLAEADVWVTSQGGGDPSAEIAAARAANPGLIVLDMSWFGRSGPYAAYAGADAVVRALSGLVRLVGPVEAPLVAPDFQALAIAGLSGCIAVLAALRQ